jgi:aconitate hydratase
VALVATYARAQGLFRMPGAPEPKYSDVLELDLSTVEPSLSGPKLPQDRIPLSSAKSAYQDSVDSFRKGSANSEGVEVEYQDQCFTLKDGDVAIAAITSCTNTSNPSVMVAAGLLARKAVQLGLNSQPWVKTSLAPGSQVVTEYLQQAGLLDDLEALGFNVVGYGCTTCIGNSGPLPEPIANAIQEGELVCTSVLSGNRNFEGRIHQHVKMNYLASPPLVVAYALAGTMDVDMYADPLGTDHEGNPVYLRDIWPSSHEVQEIIQSNIDSDMFRSAYDTVFSGDSRWQGLDAISSQQYNWDESSTYIRKPSYFDGMTQQPQEIESISGARVLALLGQSVTTDHISPAGAIAEDSPAGEYLKQNGLQKEDFNSYGSRRGNHEVMMRGTFANIRLRNLLAPGTEGGWTKHQPSGEQMSIYAAAMRYREEGTPLVVLAGKEYGTGSSRDWAAKGTRLLGVKAVIAASYERIHRSNLVGMGVLPLQFLAGEDAETLGLDGSELFDIADASAKPRELQITATKGDGSKVEFKVSVRIDTPKEWDYFMHGGILHYVLRKLASD